MGFFYFLGRGKFYLHVVIAVLLSAFILWIAILALNFYTRHGKVYLVPDFTDATVQELKDNGYDDYFDLLVIDSVYDKRHKPGAIVLQNPEPGSRVKRGRHVYLTVVARLPEKVTMPNLRNLSLRQALVQLESKGLKAGHLEFVDYSYRNAVIDQLWNDEPVESGTELTKGTVIDLVVGNGESSNGVKMPFLMGKKPDEARYRLHEASLNVGEEYFLDGNDTVHARVFKTEPDYRDVDEIPLGTAVNLWYRSDELFDFDSYIKELLSDTIANDTTNVSTENEIDEDF